MGQPVGSRGGALLLSPWPVLSKPKALVSPSDGIWLRKAALKVACWSSAATCRLSSVTRKAFGWKFKGGFCVRWFISAFPPVSQFCVLTSHGVNCGTRCRHGSLCVFWHCQPAVPRGERFVTFLFLTWFLVELRFSDPNSLVSHL